jgi:hypothetical protein
VRRIGDLAASLATLGERQQDVVVGLAPGWSGSPEELLTVAHVV